MWDWIRVASGSILARLGEDGGVGESVALSRPMGMGSPGWFFGLGGRDGEVLAVIESMNGARFVHDQLELVGWEVEIADAP